MVGTMVSDLEQLRILADTLSKLNLVVASQVKGQQDDYEVYTTYEEIVVEKTEYPCEVVFSVPRQLQKGQK